MCSVMAGIGAAVSLFQGYSSYQAQSEANDAQAESQASMARAQAQAAEHNAKMEAKKQEQIADKYGQEAKQLRARNRLYQGRLRASAGAAGLNASAGSPLDLLASGQEAYWQDQMNLLTNQRNANYDSRVTQSNYENEAAANWAKEKNIYADRDRANSALKWNTILGTAASIAGNFIGGSGGGGKSGGSAAGGTTSSGSTIASGWNANTGNYVLNSKDYTFGKINYATPLDRYLSKNTYGGFHFG